MNRSALAFARILLSAVVVLAFASPAAAFRLVPIEMEFEPTGRNATRTFQVTNDGRDPVAVEIKVYSRAMEETGKDVLKEAPDDWTIYPEQLILQPNETQSLRVQWVGTATPDRELPYRLVAEQLPIDLGKAPPLGGQVRLLVTYVASLYVIPPGAKPNLEVVSARQLGQAEGGALEIVLRNAGTMHKHLRDPTLTLESGGQRVSLKAEGLEGLAGENLLAGTTRRFVLGWPSALPAGSVRATLSLP